MAAVQISVDRERPAARSTEPATAVGARPARGEA